MKWFINLSTRTKLILGFSVMWLLLAIVIVTAYISITGISQSEKELHEVNYSKALDLRQLRSHMNLQHGQILEMMVTTDKSRWKTNEQVIHEHAQQIDEIVERLLKIDPDPECQTRLKEIKNTLVEYRQTRKEQIAFIHQGKRGKAIELGLGAQDEHIAKIRSLAQELGDKEDKEVDKRIAVDMQTAKQSLILFVFVGLIAFLLGSGMIVFLSHTIASPINALSQVAARIASRDDLAVNITADERTDEVGMLAQAFRQMVENLRRSTADISEGKRLEEKLRVASLYARSLIEASLDPLVTISPDGKITDVNKTTEQVTGISRERLVGSDFSDYFTEPDKAREGYQQVFSQGIVKDYPLTIRHSSGRTTDVLYNASVYKNEVGEVQGIFAAARDVTESKRVMQEFAETKNFLDNILQSSIKYSIIGMDLKRCILSWNEGARRNYGYTPEEILGKESSVLHTPEDIESGIGEKMLVTAYEKGLAEGEFQRVRKDGSRFVAGVVVTRRNDASGRPIGYLLMSNDISEKKRADDELKTYREQLEEMVKKRTTELANVLKEVKDTVNVLASSSSEILAATTQVASGTVETSTAISETTTTVEEVRQAAQLSAQKAKNVSDNAQRVAHVSQTGQKAVEETAAVMRHIRDQMESIAQTTVRLSEQSQSIGGIIASVTDIADQSNLLAVNAAIEAARAGEQGKGFAVVAQEIKSLAEQSKQATAQVRGILNDVQKATSAAVMATEQGSKAVDAGVKQSAQAGEAIRALAESTGEAVQTATQIVASSQQQVVGMDQIGTAMENINQAGAETAASMRQAEVSAQNLHELGQKLKELVEQFKG